MLRLVTVCHPSRAFIFYSGHPDVCTAIIIIIMIIIIIIMIIIVIIIIILIIIINSDKFLIFRNLTANTFTRTQSRGSLRVPW